MKSILTKAVAAVIAVVSAVVMVLQPAESRAAVVSSPTIASGGGGGGSAGTNGFLSVDRGGLNQFVTNSQVVISNWGATFVASNWTASSAGLTAGLFTNQLEGYYLVQFDLNAVTNNWTTYLAARLKTNGVDAIITFDSRQSTNALSIYGQASMIHGHKIVYLPAGAVLSIAGEVQGGWTCFHYARLTASRLGSSSGVGGGGGAGSTNLVTLASGSITVGELVSTNGIQNSSQTNTGPTRIDASLTVTGTSSFAELIPESGQVPAIGQIITATDTIGNWGWSNAPAGGGSGVGNGVVPSGAGMFVDNFENCEGCGAENMLTRQLSFTNWNYLVNNALEGSNGLYVVNGRLGMTNTGAGAFYLSISNRHAGANFNHVWMYLRITNNPSIANGYLTTPTIMLSSNTHPNLGDMLHAYYTGLNVIMTRGIAGELLINKTTSVPYGNGELLYFAITVISNTIYGQVNRDIFSFRHTNAYNFANSPVVTWELNGATTNQFQTWIEEIGAGYADPAMYQQFEPKTLLNSLTAPTVYGTAPATNVLFDASNGNLFRYVLTNSMAIRLTNGFDGQEVDFELYQDGPGYRTAAFLGNTGGAFTNNMRGGTVVTLPAVLTTNQYAMDMYRFRYIVQHSSTNSSRSNWVLVAHSPGYVP